MGFVERDSGLVVTDTTDDAVRHAQFSMSSIVDATFTREPPADWERRLREISPIRTDVAHLRFRVRVPHKSWMYPKDDVWMLYSWTPKHLVPSDRAWQYERHWSELPTAEQPGRKHFISDYQFWVWHTHGYDARPFWILQGNGGTPAKYTEREKRYLDASDCLSDPIPIGAMPPCRFDERAVQGIIERDRLIQAGNRLDHLAEMDRPDYLAAEDEAAERTFRETFLETWSMIMAPSVEFMKWYLRKSEADQTLPKASRETANAVTRWKDEFIQHGTVIGAKAAASRKTQILVT